MPAAPGMSCIDASALLHLQFFDLSQSNRTVPLLISY